MQIASEVYDLRKHLNDMFSKKALIPRKLKEFKIKFEHPKPPPLKQSVEEVSRVAISRWCGVVGLTTVKV